MISNDDNNYTTYLPSNAETFKHILTTLIWA